LSNEPRVNHCKTGTSMTALSYLTVCCIACCTRLERACNFWRWISKGETAFFAL